MVDNYLNNFENIVSSIFFVGFKATLVILVIALMFSLIMLAIGCLIKSQKIKSKFLKAVPGLLVITILFLLLPILVVHFKNKI